MDYNNRIIWNIFRPKLSIQILDNYFKINNIFLGKSVLDQL